MSKIYFVNGFMDAGKTKFINELIGLDYFQIDGVTLLLVCEEGDGEYDEELLRENNVYVKYIEKEEDFKEDNIVEIEKEIRPLRTIVEFNGMWNRKELQLPWYWNDIMEIAIIDASTFEIFSNNLKTYMADHVRNAYMTVFENCQGLMDKLPYYRRNVRAINSKTNFVFKDEKGEIYPKFDEDLPYDIEADKIEVSDDTFAYLYLDVMEDVERYVGKEVCFSGMVIKVQKQSLLIGRYALTCCTKDLSVFAFICDGVNVEEFNTDEWVKLKALVTKEYIDKFQMWIPILKISEIEHIEEGEKEIIEIR